MTDPQKVMNIAFELLLTRHNLDEKFKDLTNEDVAEWARDQYRKCGIETTPIGSSWAVIQEKFRD